jgi:DNA-binding transcriptional regulator LsrR (DeoR family)
MEFRPDRFRIPHKTFGTSALIITVIPTRGGIQWLGHAYALGIVWSFALKAGKPVELLVVPDRDDNRATVDAAQRLQSSAVVMGLFPPK